MRSVAATGPGERQARDSAKRRRRSLRGRGLETYGTRSKLCAGGGEVAYHSSVSASHGSFPTRTPERDVFKTLTKNTAIPSANTPELIAGTRLYHPQSPPP